MSEDEFKKNTGLDLHEQYMKYHPQELTEFETRCPSTGERNGRPTPL